MVREDDEIMAKEARKAANLFQAAEYGPCLSLLHKLQRQTNHDPKVISPTHANVVRIIDRAREVFNLNIFRGACMF